MTSLLPAQFDTPASSLIPQPEAAPYQAHFQPMGLNLHLISNHPAILEAAQSSFGRFGPGPNDSPPDLIFHLLAHPIDEGPPGPPIFRLNGAQLFQSTGPHDTLTADLADGRAYGRFSTAILANPPFFRWHFLELAFFMMLEWRGWMGVHGAALVKNGQAILLRARSGGGKTTLAYAAARRTLQALAEDVVWLDGSRNLWWGMPWSFHLLPDAKRLFPELAPYSPTLQTNGEMKLEVNLETIRPGSTTVAAQPAALVLLERLAGGRSRLEPLSLEMARSLWPGGAAGLEMQLPHHPRHLETLFNLKTYYLYFGDDIPAAVELLELLFNKEFSRTQNR